MSEKNYFSSKFSTFCIPVELVLFYALAREEEEEYPCVIVWRTRKKELVGIVFGFICLLFSDDHKKTGLTFSA